MWPRFDRAGLASGEEDRTLRSFAVRFSPLVGEGNRARRLSLAAILAAVMIGIVAPLRDEFPATAVDILVCSLGLVTNVLGRERDWRHMQWLSGAFALSFTTGNLVEYVIGVSGSSWLRDVVPVPLLLTFANDPGLMSPLAIVCFYLLSAVVLLMPTRRAAIGKAAATNGLVCLGAVLLGHLFDHEGLTGSIGSLPVSPFTAGSLALLFLAALLMKPEVGPLRRIVGNSPGATLARLLLPVILIGPTVIVWIFLQVGRLGLYGAEVQLALTTISTVLILAGAAIFAAARIDALQGARDMVARELTVNRSRLEAVVRNMPIGVAVMDAPSGHVVLRNARVDAIRRSLAPASPTGRSLDPGPGDPLSGEVLQGLDWPAEQVLGRGETISDMEVPVLRSDGTSGWISLSAAPVREEGGQVTSAVLAFLDITERKTAEQERIDLLRRIVRAQEEERLRIARELHDQMGQDLVSLSLGLKTLETVLGTPQAEAALAALRSTVERMSIEVHRTAVELRPTSLGDLGLRRALATLIQTWAERLSIQADTHLDDLDNFAHLLTEEAEIAMYRGVQEALTNIAKHSGARHIGVVAQRLGNALRIVVEDDGQGFAPGDEAVAGTARLGLKGLRERLLLVGGEFVAESAPGKGATLILSVPFLPELSGSRAA